MRELGQCKIPCETETNLIIDSIRNVVVVFTRQRLYFPRLRKFSGQVTAYKSTWLGSDITSTRMNSAYLTAFLLLATALLAVRSYFSNIREPILNPVH